MSEKVGSLAYASAEVAYDHLRRARVLRRIVLGCALVPMALGVGIVLAYWLFDWDWLILAGMILLPVGGLTILAGLIFGMREFVERLKFAKKSSTRLPYWPIIASTLLLLANVPVAFGCAAWGIHLSISPPTVLVVITNHSGATLDHCDIVSTWSSRPHATLSNAGTIEDYLKLRRAGGLRVHLVQGGVVQDIPLPIPSSFDRIGGHFNVDVQPGLHADVKSGMGGVSD